jgi:hypothetical protein
LERLTRTGFHVQYGQLVYVLAGVKLVGTAAQ